MRQTLPRSIAENADFFPNVEFVLLDYNSKDGLEDWVKTTMKMHLDQGVLVYLKTTDPQYFHRSHSRNMAFRNASGDVLVNLDADNFAGKGFAAYVDHHFQQKRNIYMVPDRSRADLGGAFGKVCLRKSDFMKVGGYDERISGWGYEDTDLFFRLQLLGLKERKIINPRYLQYIDHSNEERIKNQRNFDTVKWVYVGLAGSRSEVMLFYKDGTLERGTVIDNNQNVVALTGSSALTLVEPEWIKGTWNQEGNVMQLTYSNRKPDRESFRVGNAGTIISSNEEQKVFTKIQSNKLINYSLMVNEAIKNYIIFKSNADNKIISVNDQLFGSGSIVRNFGPVGVLE